MSRNTSLGPADPVPADDRAFLYGDGLFETLLVLNGRPLWEQLHVDRLLEGGQRLAIPLDRDLLSEQLRELAASAPAAGAATLRLTVSRGSAPRGYAPPPTATPRFVASIAALTDDPFVAPAPLAVGIATLQIAEQPALAGIKHCNRLEQVLAAAEAVRRGLDDVLMCTQAGFVQCSSNANVFLLRGGQLLTPPCDRCGVRGTRRRLLLETLAPSLGLATLEQPLTVSDLRAGDALLLSNSVRGLRPVARLEDHGYEPSPLLNALQQAYCEAMRTCSAH